MRTLIAALALLPALALAQPLPPPAKAAPVQTVAGRTGAVTIGTGDVSGLGTIATQSTGAVAITGGTISGADVSAATNIATGATNSQATAARATNEFLWAPDFGSCAWDGTHDVSSCIQAAINAAGTLGGRTVLIPPSLLGVYVNSVWSYGWPIASTLTLGNGNATTLSTQNTVVLAGVGQPFNRIGLWNSLGNTGTVLKWTGASGGTMVAINGPTAGNALRNIAMDANSLANTCLAITSGRAAEFPDLTCKNYQGTGLNITTQAATSIYNNDGSQLSSVQLRFSNLQIAGNAGSTAINLDGYIANASWTGSISGTTLTVTSVSGGTILSGMTLVGGSIPSSVTITALGTGTGGTGTYTISQSLTVSSEVMSGIMGGMDTTRVTFDNTNIGVPLTASSVGIRLAFADQNVFHNTIMGTSGTSDGTSCSVSVVSSPAPAVFPQNIVFTGHTDMGHGLKMCAGAQGATTAPGPGIRFDNMTTLDSQVPPGDPVSAMLSGTYTGTDGWRGEWGQRVIDREWRNKLLNATFSRATRGASFTQPASGAPLWDGTTYEYNGTLSGSFVAQRLLLTGISGVFNNTPTNVYNPQYYVNITLDKQSGGTSGALAWHIPGARTLAGRPTVFSAFMVGGSATPTLYVNVIQHFGTGGSPSANVSTSSSTGGLTTAGGAWSRMQWQISVPSVNGYTFGTNGDDWVEVVLYFPWNGGGAPAGASIYLTAPQWEQGWTASAWEQRPFEVEEPLMARTIRLAGAGLIGYAADTTHACLSAPFGGRMWKAPAVSLLSGATVSVSAGGSTVTASSPAVSSTPAATANGAGFCVSGFSGLTAGAALMGITDFALISAEP